MSDPFRTNDPTQFDDIDGIVIDERAPAPRVQGVPANVAGMVGQFERGPETVQEPGSAARLGELYGANDLYSGRKELKNKRFGRLRLIRVVASDAAKAAANLSGAASSEVAEVSTLTTTDDSSGDSDGLAVLFQTIDPTTGLKVDRYLWWDVDGGGNDPAISGRTGHAVAIATDDTAATKATAAGLVLAAIAGIASATPAAGVVTITLSQEGNVTDATGNAKDTIGITTQGDGPDVLTICAKYRGAYGNSLSVQVEAGSNSGRKYTIKDNTTNAVLQTEIYDDVTIVGKDQDQINQIFAASSLIDAVLQGTPTDEPREEAEKSLAGGTDGTIADTDYEAAIDKALPDSAAINALFSDKYNATIRAKLKTHAVESQNKQVIMADDDENQSVAGAISEVANQRDADGRIIYCYPYIETRILGAVAKQSPASWMASIISQTSPHIDPAFTGNVGFTAGITALCKDLTRAEFIQLKDAGISALERDPDVGIKFRMGITTQIANSSKQTILRRRMADFLTNSIGRLLKNFQNAPNTAGNRRDVAGAIVAFDNGLIQDGILPADSEVQDGAARLIDTESLNTNDSIGLGLFKILFKRRIFSSMRYIVFQAEIGETVVVTEGE